MFVFGRFAEDLKTVDYEAIAMLNVSATQEVAQQLEVAQLEIKELKDENRILQSRLDKIERMLQDRAPETPQTQSDNTAAGQNVARRFTSMVAFINSFVR